ncbi:MAG: STAS domain-containing protein [Magnetococcales bacterium]|nr:STAS domain-containing protein [Magnetococcales bacterium]
MNIAIDKNTATIVLPGQFDYTAMKPFIEASGRIAGSDVVVVDFRHVAYIDSSGISSLFRLWEMVDGRDCIRIVNARQDIRELLDLTGYVRLIGEKAFSSHDTPPAG